MAENCSPVFSEFSPAADGVLYRQAANFLRDRILCGNLPGGTRLPGVRELSSRWNMDVSTVHKALSILEKAGLLNKTQEVGTFVREEIPATGLIGLLLIGGGTREGYTQFHSTLMYLVSAQLAELGYETVLIQQYLPDEACTRPPELLLQLIDARRLQAVAVINAPGEAHDWLERLRLPMAALWRNPIEPGIFAPLKKILDSGKFHRPFLLLPTTDAKPHNRNVIDELMDCGIDWKHCRHAFLDGGKSFGLGHHAIQAHEILTREFASDAKPDLLFVFPDEAYPGVVAAIYEARLRVPEDLTLVLHRNREFKFFSPFPAIYIDFSVAESAGHLIAQLKLQSRRPKMEHS